MLGHILGIEIEATIHAGLAMSGSAFNGRRRRRRREGWGVAQCGGVGSGHGDGRGRTLAAGDQSLLATALTINACQAGHAVRDRPGWVGCYDYTQHRNSIDDELRRLDR